MALTSVWSVLWQTWLRDSYNLRRFALWTKCVMNQNRASLVPWIQCEWIAPANCRWRNAPLGSIWFGSADWGSAAGSFCSDDLLIIKKFVKFRRCGLSNDGGEYCLDPHTFVSTITNGVILLGVCGFPPRCTKHCFHKVLRLCTLPSSDISVVSIISDLLLRQDRWTVIVKVNTLNLALCPFDADY